MRIFEKLGLFYLGKVYNTRTAALSEDYLLYDSKDLVTHAMCVGMTGSGKTGLGIGLLEEAAIDHIPAIIIDPKGDLGNLLLTFPDLRGEDFLPWINPDEAAKKDLSPEEFAGKQADLWKNGLSQWSEDGERIRRFKSSTDFAIYTPGSSAGLQVSIIKSFSAPDRQGIDDMDLLRDRIQTTTSGILELLGIKADPLRSREHILISNIIEHAWMKGEDLDLGSLIQMIQSPPITRIGVFDIESFYPATDRFKLSMTLNNLLAAPAFKSWMEGEPLDIGNMLHTDSGKPRVVIFSIAHLSDSERMFFVTLLLNQVLGWIRSQSGTTSLRTVLYMDEIFGFLPPVGEPPSKKPLLTLLKQARAYGLGVVLATQNPVDLDYKALSNIGTWFIGRLQTDRDKERLADGLTSARADQIGLDKRSLMKTISGLKKRHFLLHNVHEKHPQIFMTRWALSYLRGPLTRNQIKRLMQDKISSKPAPPSKTVASTAAESEVSAGIRPQLPPEIKQYFAPPTQQVSQEAKIIYHPYLFAGGEIQLFNNRYGIAQNEQVAHALPLATATGVSGFSWEQASALDFQPQLVNGDPEENAAYQSLPSEIMKIAIYNRLDRQYETFVYRNYRVVLWKSNLTKLISRPGETERDFRIRLKESSHERRSLEMDRLKRKYASKINTLQRQLISAQQRVDKESNQYEQKKMEAALSLGTGLLGALFGGRSRRSIGTATRSATRLSKEKQDIYRAQEKLAQVQDRLQQVQKELEDESTQIAEKFDPGNEPLRQIVIRPKKSDILQKYYGILWVPFVQGGKDSSGSLNAAFD